jgi:peptidyl-prolyl cis-trans isomerase D
MLSFIRRISKSKIGTWVMAAVLIAILGGFALADLSNFGTGSLGFGMNSGTLIKVGDQEINERDVNDLMQRRLQQVRQQRPEVDIASIIGDLDGLLDSLVTDRALMAFADKYGFPLSKRLIDAEITQLPATKGLDGKFSEQRYQQFLQTERMSDAQVRELLAGGLVQRLLLTPVAVNGRISVGMATPYASMLLESRQGEAAVVPVDAFKAGLKPSDAQLQSFYAANRGRYVVPEQRVLRIARIGPEQVAGVSASDQEIAAYYNTNKATYATTETRSLTQVVVQDAATANAIAQRAKAGATLAAAAAPAGNNAAVSTLKDQSRDAYAGVAGQKAAAAVFAAPSGALVGPIQSDFGWVIAKIDSVKAVNGKSLDQARAEIAAKLNADKRKGAVEDLVDKVQNAVDGGSNFADAVASAKLAVTATPLITANGVSRTDASFKLPPELAPTLKAGFEIGPSDPPEIVSLSGEAGYALVSPGQVVPAAPAPLASIRDQVAADWVNDQAMQRARTAAAQIAAKASGAVSLADAVKAAGVALPPVQPVTARRLQIGQAQGNTAAALKALFTGGAGSARMVANPQGGGFFVVKVDKIVPGNVLLDPALIGQVRSELGQAAAQDYAEEFIADLKRDVKVKRNDNAIQAFRTKLLTGGG